MHPKKRFVELSTRNLLAEGFFNRRSSRKDDAKKNTKECTRKQLEPKAFKTDHLRFEEEFCKKRENEKIGKRVRNQRPVLRSESNREFLSDFNLVPIRTVPTLANAPAHCVVNLQVAKP